MNEINRATPNAPVRPFGSARAHSANADGLYEVKTERIPLIWREDGDGGACALCYTSQGKFLLVIEKQSFELGANYICAVYSLEKAKVGHYSTGASDGLCHVKQQVAQVLQDFLSSQSEKQK